MLDELNTKYLFWKSICSQPELYLFIILDFGLCHQSFQCKNFSDTWMDHKPRQIDNIYFKFDKNIPYYLEDSIAEHFIHVLSTFSFASGHWTSYIVLEGFSFDETKFVSRFNVLKVVSNTAVLFSYLWHSYFPVDTIN